MFALEDLDCVQGSVSSFEAHRGRTVLVVEFWATWCPPCRSSIPHLNQLYQTYRHRQVEFVGVSSSEERGPVEEFVRKMGKEMSYTVAVDPRRVSQSLMQQYNVTGIPCAFVVAADGQVVWHGHPMDEALERSLEKAVRTMEKQKRDAVGLLKREDLEKMSVRDLKTVLFDHGVSSTGCVEKSDIVERILSKVIKQ